MIGIVIPAHNEVDALPDCLTALNHAIDLYQQQCRGMPQPVQTIVVLDCCTDESERLIQHYQDSCPALQFICCDFHCVGRTRDLGIRYLIQQGAQWIANTDADSQVHPNWLLEQIRHQPCDMICGVVEVEDWGGLSLPAQQLYRQHYQDKMGHQHIHGANLSFSAQLYQRLGGFAAMHCHEDVNLVQRCAAEGGQIVWSNRVRVRTSSRLQGKAPEGFACFLSQLECK